MKNTVRRIIAMAIALVMVFGSVPAFATEIGDTVVWYKYTDSSEHSQCVISDKITTDRTVAIKRQAERTDYYYILDVKNPGYYLINEEGDFSFKTPEIFENGVAYGEIYDYLWCNDQSIYYFEKGENLFRLGVPSNDYAVISFEYLGETITNVGYDETCLQNLIIGCEVADDHADFQLEHFSDVDITFSSGKTFCDVYADNIFRYDAPLKEGENTGVMVLPGHDEPITFTAYPVSKYIESMEITNVEKLLEVKQDYLGYYIHPDVCKETVTVKFTDGTKLETHQLIDTNRGMNFINGHHYQLLTEYTETDDGLIFELGFNKHMFDAGDPILYSAPCKISRASVIDNIRVLSREIRSDLNYISNVKSFIYACKYVITDICEFFDYYI